MKFFLRLFFIILPLLLSNSQLKAQYTHWVNFTEGNIIYQVYANDSILWIGTRGGLVKVQDGEISFYNKTNSPLPDNHVIAIKTDHQGRLWLGTWDGVAVIEGQNWTIYNHENSPLYDDAVFVIEEDPGGALWMGTQTGLLAKFYNETWQLYDNQNSGIPQNDIYSIAIDSSGNKWIGYWTEGLANFDDTNWTFYSYYNGDFPDVVRIYDILLHHDTLLLSTLSYYLKIHDASWLFYDSHDFYLLVDAFYKSYFDENNDQWLVTGTGLVNIHNGSITVYDEDEIGMGCVNFWKADSYEAKNYFGSFGAGLVSYDGQDWSRVNTSASQLWGNEVLSVVIDSTNTLWALSNRPDCQIQNALKLQSFSNNKWSDHTNASQMPPFNYKEMACDTGGSLWLLHNKGLVHLNGLAWDLIEVPPLIASQLSDSVYMHLNGMVIDKYNNFWMFAYGANGIIKYGNGSWTYYSQAQIGLPEHMMITDITADRDGNVWFCCYNTTFSGSQTIYDALLYKFNGTTFTYTVLYTIKNHFNIPTCLSADQTGNIWVGTRANGLIRVTGSTITFFPVSPSNPVYTEVFPVSTSNGTALWLATQSSGLLYFDGVSFTVFHTGNSGVASNLLGHNSIAIDSCQNLWVGSYFGGVSVFNNNIDCLPYEISDHPGDTIPERAEGENCPRLFPNPASGHFRLDLSCIPVDTPVEISLYNVLGDRLASYHTVVGEHYFETDLPALADGVYLVAVNSPFLNKTVKMVIFK